jgi:RimJ/RimL family protein N-acetyltransferase
MIPPLFTDVPRECLDVYSDVFRMCDARVYDDDDDLFFVKLENECSFLDSIPSVTDGELTLCEIKEEHLTEYARLCRDKDLNKYWGYDVTEDNEGDTDQYFLDVAMREFDTCIAVTLGIYLGDSFIGEGVIYEFDYKGGASLALRILPEYQKRGFGKRSFALLIEVARMMRLISLRAEVMEENLPSIKMTSHFLDVEKREGGRVYFKKNI